MNWYKIAQINNLEKEAGWTENITATLLSAIVAIFLGSTIHSASQKYGLSEQQIENALHDEDMVNKANEKFNQINQPQTQAPEEFKNELESSMSLDELIPFILKHEGLIEKQTPFRYTSNVMRQWDTIHGFPIDKESSRPSNRKNFIFLKNHNDVPKAVKKQFENYVQYPDRYGFSSNPSLGEALAKFDQSGVAGKIEFLTRSFPTLDLNESLRTYLL